MSQPDFRVEQILGLLERPGTHAHLLGLGGVGMAGLARLLAARGVKVSGCDLAQNRMTEWLATHGVRAECGHDPAHLEGDVTWVIRSTAVPETIPELARARALGLAIFSRGAVLAALLEGRRSVAVSGTHGKTTTASMIAQVLRACGHNPGFCIGGETDRLGGVAGPGDGRLLVVEADESDGTVALYRPDVAVVTNIEYDHMEHFEGKEDVERCFAAFVGQARERVVYAADDEAAGRVCRAAPHGKSYGFSQEADCVGRVIAQDARSVTLRVEDEGAQPVEFTVGVPGRQNALNALAAYVAACHLGCAPEHVGRALQYFQPVRRRFETVAERAGIRVISDYAHHPTEIRAVLQMAKAQRPARLLAVFQPHRYTRTRALGPDFPPAFHGIERLYLTPVYAASEPPIEGGRGEDLYKKFEEYGAVRAVYCETLKAAWNRIRSDLRRGDLLLVLGAGDVERIAAWAREELEGGAWTAEHLR